MVYIQSEAILVVDFYASLHETPLYYATSLVVRAAVTENLYIPRANLSTCHI